MSVEHGGHGGKHVTFANIISSIFLALVGRGAITEHVEDLVKLVAQGKGGHGH